MASIEEELRTTFLSEQHKALLHVIYTGNWLLSLHAEWLKEFELSPQQYNMLRIVKGAGTRMSMNDIKSRMLDKTPNVTRLSDRLVDRNLLIRSRCDLDRRVVYLEMTPKGLDLLADVEILWLHKDLPEQKLTEKEAAVLNNMLHKMRN